MFRRIGVRLKAADPPARAAAAERRIPCSNAGWPMPRYFFHVHDGEDFTDLQGTELVDMEAARLEAVRFAAALLRDKADSFWNDSEWRLRVTNKSDLTLFELTFFGTIAPAGRNEAPT